MDQNHLCLHLNQKRINLITTLADQHAGRRRLVLFGKVIHVTNLKIFLKI